MPLSWHSTIFISFKHGFFSPSAFSLLGALFFPCSMCSAVLLRSLSKAQGLPLLSPPLTTAVPTPACAEIAPKQHEMCRRKHSVSSFSPFMQFGLISLCMDLGRCNPGTSNEGVPWLLGPWARLKTSIWYFSISGGGGEYIS